jgi:Phosphotransferase enzyme family
VLPLLHATPVPSQPPIRPYRPYYLDSPELVPPSWTTRPDLWHRAIAVHRAWSASDDRVLVHRDFHPDNVLFTGTRVSGLVDWANASMGPPDVDVGHCRLNLALFVDLEAADRFRDLWLVASGRDHYDTTADVLAVVGLLPDWPPSLQGVGALELMLERAMNEPGT